MINTRNLLCRDGRIPGPREKRRDKFDFLGMVQERLGEGDGFMLLGGTVAGCEADL